MTTEIKKKNLKTNFGCFGGEVMFVDFCENNIKKVLGFGFTKFGFTMVVQGWFCNFRSSA